MIVSDNYFN